MLERRSRAAGAIVPALIAALLAGCGGSSGGSSSHHTKTTTSTTRASMKADTRGGTGPEGIPLERGPALASASSTAPGITVDGIQCTPVEQLVDHIHAHLQVYLEGRPRSLPGAIGMLGPVPQPTPYGPFYAATQCYYWLHTHTSDGVIHIESPTRRIYTLGEFFDEWGQPLSGEQVAGVRGRVTAFINGRRWTTSPRALPLLSHAVIQLDVGAPVVRFARVSWAGTDL